MSEVKRSRTALIMIDMINKMDFEGGHNLLENTRSIMGNLQDLKQEAKKRDVPVIYVNDNFGLWQDNVAELIEECQQGPGKEVIQEIIPEDDDFFIIKPKHSGFYGTQLTILLNQIGAENLVMTGIAGDICVLFTANDAYMREYNIYVPKDCVASEHHSDNENALQIMKRSLFADLRESHQLNWEELK
ncbi:cysteine hydrolase family protein [Thalassobacillus sp. CUG 92003]|uniref:cysteine hydrolase family protein n=1 Tax=Thalassobacillus sp. CUG 92003 TaxID=2736641 RepID=UPI0015E635D8|nr:isochorismatase family cysteine hydrolase [Thalassobacillus sp. CUG 92003]